LPPQQVEDLQLQLAQAEGALEHYRQAFALELSAASLEPPPAGAGPTDQNDSSPKSDPGRRGGGAASRARRVRTAASSRRVPFPQFGRLAGGRNEAAAA
jgi:hypothetical protein